MSPVEVQERTENVRTLEGVQYGVSNNGDAMTAMQELCDAITAKLAWRESASIALTWTLDAGYANEQGRGKLTWRVVITTTQHRLERWEP